MRNAHALTTQTHTLAENSEVVVVVDASDPGLNIQFNLRQRQRLKCSVGQLARDARARARPRPLAKVIEFWRCVLRRFATPSAPRPPEVARLVDSPRRRRPGPGS